MMETIRLALRIIRILMADKPPRGHTICLDCGETIATADNFIPAQFLEKHLWHRFLARMTIPIHDDEIIEYLRQNLVDAALRYVAMQQAGGSLTDLTEVRSELRDAGERFATATVLVGDFHRIFGDGANAALEQDATWKRIKALTLKPTLLKEASE